MRVLLGIGALSVLALSGCISAEEVQERRLAEAERQKNTIYVKRAGRAMVDGPPDDVICVVRKTAASRLNEHKTCRTRREWRNRAIDTTREMNNLKEAAGRNGPKSQ